MKRTIAATALIAASALVLGGCSSADGGKAESTATAAPTATVSASRASATEAVGAASGAPPTTRAVNKPAGYVSEETWTDGEWPFTVTEGTLMCGKPSRVTFVADRKIYGINGSGKPAADYDLEDIWKLDDSGLGMRVNIGPMLNKGLTLC